MPDIVLDYHRRRVPIDHPDLSVTGGKLGVDVMSRVEVPTAFPGLWGLPPATMKAQVGKIVRLWGAGASTEDELWRHVYAVTDDGDSRRLLFDVDDLARLVGDFTVSTRTTKRGRGLYVDGLDTDERIVITDYVLADIDAYWYIVGESGGYIDRLQDHTLQVGETFGYLFLFDAYPTPQYIGIYYVTYYWIEEVIAEEDTTLSKTTYYAMRGEISGSTLKLYLDGVLRLVGTHTALASGMSGLAFLGYNVTFIRLYRRPLGTQTGSPRARAIVEVEGEKTDRGYRPVTEGRLAWGAFEISSRSPTNIVMLYSGEVDRQVELARRRGLRVLPAPGDHAEALEQYRALRRDFPHWLAGKDNYVYQATGIEVFNLFQNIDFYHGELLEHKTHYNQLKRVPEWELRRRLGELVDRLGRVNVLTEERDKHIRKAKEVLTKGW